MKNTSNTLGIDIGSVSISVAELNSDKEILNSTYAIHQGNIKNTLLNLLKDFDLNKITNVVATSSSTKHIQTHKYYDNQLALIAAVKEHHSDFRSILFVGGEKFGLMTFDDQGNYLNYQTNTSCAAGTGSFLDQQATRLNLTNIEEMSKIAFQHKGKIPKIASRCAVFAKTDLIHAQQEGYSLSEICDGLCLGLAKNITDTLLKNQESISPLIFCGGVAKNKAVVEHIRELTGLEIIVNDKTHLYGAIGAAINAIEDGMINENTCHDFDFFATQSQQKTETHDPIALTLSDYPDFTAHENYEFTNELDPRATCIEVEIYQELKKSQNYDVYLGIDIGSTSTKAILLDNDQVIAGFYTRTLGRPLDAVCSIFAAIDNVKQKNKINLSFIRAGTTGSGRKFIGKLINADLIIDEITAHAKAAHNLNPDVDTIIEIGGQDSKFTTLKDGQITFAIMNNVCAAGTGSFIEEQAAKLNCSLKDFAKQVENVKAPLTSDRCTVFMERDINYYLSEGHSRQELLASVLHSVRDNYLTKVAREAKIGKTIFFQGATARNKALVAVFEQQLKKPILVSKYCHLTGALGTALTLKETEFTSVKTGFRGLDLYKKEIPVSSEVCDLCTNHCKITVADINYDKVAYGFLCGRDYDTQKYVNNNKSGFDLMRSRKKAFQFKARKDKPKIGLPAALYMIEDIPFWKKFFDLLSFTTVTSESMKDAVKIGKQISGAEFCAPISVMHAHAHYLLNKADYVFVPYYLENKQKDSKIRRQYCYYSQYIPSLIANIDETQRHRILTPTIKYLYQDLSIKFKLYKMLNNICENSASFLEISNAYDQATEFKKERSETLKQIYVEESKKSDDINVILLGRPYTILSPSLNHGIGDIFSSLGIKTFYQDMIPYSDEDVKNIQPLLKRLHWNYAAKILEVAEVTAKSKDTYAVLITAFKCSPDSFIIDYFKDIMESYNKPYLILELDDHDSSVGYETRIEAAIRSFRNHAGRVSTEKTLSHRYLSINTELTTKIEGKSIVMPNWDNLTCAFLTAIMKREGYDAHLIEETPETIQKSLKHNTGQCIPINTITQGFVECVQKNKLDPSKTVLWLLSSSIACNIALYPQHIKTLFASYGKDVEGADIYTGQLTFMDISFKASLDAYFAYMFGGLLRKAGCKIRPYEVNKGETDKVMTQSRELLIEAFLGKTTKDDALKQIASWFQAIEIEESTKPKVAIFGDLYARDNDVMNQNLLHFIEEHGGEVITTPYSQYAKMIANKYFQKWFTEGKYVQLISRKTMLATMNQLEKIYYKYFEKILKAPLHAYDEPTEKILSEYNITAENTGESMDNILKIYYIKKHYPDVSLFVQTNPALCCPSLITEAMMKKIEKTTGVPVVSITYDGTGGNKNNAIIPYLKYPRNQANNVDVLKKTG